MLSHELAHALISAATQARRRIGFRKDRAAHRDGHPAVNPLPDLDPHRDVLSFPTVDPILRGFAEEQFVDLAYSEAAWSIAFIEERYGAAAIPKLLSAFAAGKTTEQALQAVCGVTPAEFDRALWQWGTGPQGPRVRALEVRDYEQEYAYLERHEQQASGPHTQLREDVPTQARTRIADRRQRMADWYAAYVERTASVKRALKPVLNAYNGESVPEKGSIAGACQVLSVETGQALAASEPWSSPDPSSIDRSATPIF